MANVKGLVKGNVLVLKNPSTMEQEYVSVEKLVLSDGITTVGDLIYELGLLQEANKQLTESNTKLAKKCNNIIDAYKKNKAATKAEIANIKAAIEELGGNL